MATAERDRAEEIGLHNLKPKPGSKGRASGSAAARARAARPRAAATRAPARARARRPSPATRAARTRSTCGCGSCAARTKRVDAVENFRTKTQPVNLADLEERFDDGAEVTVEPLKEKGLATRRTVKTRPR